MRRVTLGAVGIVALIAGVAGCGSGDGGSSPPPAVAKAEGVWTGQTSRPVNASIAVVLEDDVLWFIEGVASGSLDVWGFSQGQGRTGADRSFTVADARMTSAASTPGAETLEANFTPNASLSGQWTSAVGGKFSFADTPFPSTQYRYDVPALLGDVLGAWSGRFWNSNWEGIACLSQADAGGTDRPGFLASVSIGADGSFGGKACDCNFSGTLRPRASGKNVFDATIAIGGPPCADPGVTASGIGLVYRLPDGTSQLVVVAQDRTRELGFSFFAAR